MSMADTGRYDSLPPGKVGSGANSVQVKNRDEWIDLTGVEKERTYHYPEMILSDGTKIPATKYTVLSPVALKVNSSGSHVVFGHDEEGTQRHFYFHKGFHILTFVGKYGFDVK